MQYVMEGIAPAPTYFYVEQTSGNVFVRQDLKTDMNLVYTVSKFRLLLQF